MLMTCTGCAAEFHARADAAYCSAACRQRAHRKRNAPHVTASQYRPQPILYADGCAPVADPNRLRRAINIGNSNYDAHISADELRRTLGTHAPEWADRVDDCIEWLSVVRDGLRGMDADERCQASVGRCGRGGQPSTKAMPGERPGATSYSRGIQGMSVSIGDICDSLTDEQIMEALGAAQFLYEMLRGAKIIRERKVNQK
jgi:hypothetical protein